MFTHYFLQLIALCPDVTETKEVLIKTLLLAINILSYDKYSSFYIGIEFIIFHLNITMHIISLIRQIRDMNSTIGLTFRFISDYENDPHLYRPARSPY